MKNILKRLPKKLFAAAATVAILAGVASSAMAGFGPDRPTKAWSDNLNGFDHVTFNSFTGVPAGVGDERNFLRGVQVGRDSVWSDPVNNVSNNAEVEVKIYIHNNASSSLNDQPGNPGVAKDVNVRAVLPTGNAQTQQITSFISASNAQPQQIFDTLDVNSANTFGISFVAGSAKMFNHENGQTTAISDTLVTSGVSLPDQKGCFEYTREITFRVKVSKPSYNVKKQVRLPGQTKDDWKENLNVTPGQSVEWKVEFTNTGSTLLNDVIILDQVPAGLTVVPGSVKQFDGNYPNGYAHPDAAIQNNGRQVNVNVGNVNPGINSVIMFQTKVDNNAVSCGTGTLINSGYATPKGFGSITDTASVTVNSGKPCVGPTYVCENLDVEKLTGRKVRVTVKPAVTGQNVTAKHIVINYGDGSTPKVTNNKVNGNFVDEYEFKADGSFKVTGSIVFTVDGVDQAAKSSDNCAEVVTYGATTTTTLPKTGAGSVIGLFAAFSAAGAAAHNVISRRRAVN
jgi:uncharacterized repeat protein (TIGR01451 family)